MNSLERLYLCMDPCIYIDVPSLPQHQIDGIRFLFKQFRKTRKGVILNDPPGYGKTLQVVLFLNATRNLHQKGTLVLCSPEKAEKWRLHFEEWTAFDDTVVLESFNPYKRDMVVCINASDNIAPFAQRFWSIIVIDNDDNKAEILKHTFKATYTIWISSVNMKQNVSLFSAILKWLKLEANLTVEDFTSDKFKVPDDMTRCILLDAFMRDIVLRRTDFRTPFIDKEKTSNTYLQPTRKNKDITGTKIKRSKKPSSNDNQQNTVHTVPTIKPDNVDKNVEAQGKMDIDGFISIHKPIEIKGVKEKIMFEDIPMYEASGTGSNANLNTSGNSADESTALNISNASTLPCEDTDSKDVLDMTNNLMADAVMEDFDFEINKTVESYVDEELNVPDTRKIDKESCKGYDHNFDDAMVAEEEELKDKGCKSLDAILQEMEEKSLQKYKGSLLDDIFK